MSLRSFFLAVVFSLTAMVLPVRAADEPPLSLARDGWFYVGGHLTTVNNKQYMTGQMYVEYRIPAKKTHPYPIIMVHGGTMSGTNYTGTPDGREGWAQYFVRQGYAAYVVDQVGKGRSSYIEQTYGPTDLVDSQNSQQRYVAQEKYDLYLQRRVCGRAGLFQTGSAWPHLWHNRYAAHLFPARRKRIGTVVCPGRKRGRDGPGEMLVAGRAGASVAQLAEDPGAGFERGSLLSRAL